MRNSFIPKHGIRSQAFILAHKEQNSQPLRPASMTHSSRIWHIKTFQLENLLLKDLAVLSQSLGRKFSLLQVKKTLE